MGIHWIRLVKKRKILTASNRGLRNVFVVVLVLIGVILSIDVSFETKTVPKCQFGTKVVPKCQSGLSVVPNCSFYTRIVSKYSFNTKNVQNAYLTQILFQIAFFFTKCSKMVTVCKHFSEIFVVPFRYHQNCSIFKNWAKIVLIQRLARLGIET